MATGTRSGGDVDALMQEIALTGGRPLVLAELDARAGHKMSAREVAVEDGMDSASARDMAESFLDSVVGGRAFSDDFESIEQAVAVFERRHSDRADEILESLGLPASRMSFESVEP